MFHRIDKLQELITAWKRELLRAQRHALQCFGRIAVYDPGLLCHLEHMPQSRERVVVSGWGGDLTKRSRPFLTIRSGNTPDFPICQVRPAFQQRREALPTEEERAEMRAIDDKLDAIAAKLRQSGTGAEG